jgi:hypothetical protein
VVACFIEQDLGGGKLKNNNFGGIKTVFEKKNISLKMVESLP